MSQLQALRMIVATVASVALVVSVTPRAEAHHLSNFYCSESGDICQSTRKVEGKRKLGLLMADRLFGRFELCVTSPIGVTCKDFRVREHDGDLWGRDLVWRRHFPDHGPGRYTVKWYRIRQDGAPWKHGARIGEVLGFHLR